MTGKSSRPLLEPGLRNTLREKSQRQRQAVAALTDASRASRAFRNDLRPDLTLIERPIATLKVPERQVRKLEPHHVRELAEGIRHFGFTVPILIDEAEGVIDGVARIEAAKLTGLTSLPCIVAGHLTSNQRRLLRLAANRLAERGAWALDELRLELSELSIEEAPIELTGFSGPEIDQILSVDELELVENGSLVPLDGALATARPGDIFTLGEHRIACGDATDPTALAALLNGAEARLILTDEPYNVPIGGHVSSGQHREFVMASGEMTADQFRQFNLTWIGAALAHLQDGGIFGSFIDWRGYPVLHGAAMEHGLHILNLIVWVKTNAGMGSLYRSQHELLPLFRKGSGPHVNNIQLGRTGRWRSNVWTYPGATSLGSDARRGLQDHPTVKPAKMLEGALLDLTKAGEIVLDPFLGSGSTLIAAQKTRRRCYGLELDPPYVDVVIRRFEEVTGKAAILIKTGESFKDLAARRRIEVPPIS